MAYGDYKDSATLQGTITPNMTPPAGEAADVAWIKNGEPAAQAIDNRPHKAIADNCDILKERFDDDKAIGEVSAFTASGGSTSAITIDPDNGGGSHVNFDGSLYLGTVGDWPAAQEGRDTLFELLDSNYNEVVVSNAKVIVTGVSETVPGGFHTTGIVTLTLSATIPDGSYRLGYGIGTTLADLPEAALMKLDVRGLHEASAQQTADMVQYSGGPTWHDGTTNPATDAESQLDKLVTDLVADDGADRIGAVAQTSDLEPMVAGSVEDQVTTLTARLDALEQRDIVARAINWTPRAMSAATVPADVAVGGDILGSGQRRHNYVFVAGAAGVEVQDGFFGPVTAPAFSTPAPTAMAATAWGLAGLATGIWVAVGQRGPTPGSNGAAIETSLLATTSPWLAATVPSPYNTGAWVFSDVLYDVSNDYFVAVGGDGGAGVMALRSSDGTTWTAASTPPAAAVSRLVDDGAGNVLAYGANIYKSTDGGDTWSLVLTGPPAFIYIAYEARSGRWAGLVVNGGVNDFYLSDDATATSWTSKLAGVTTSRDFNSLACDGRGLIMLGGAGGELRWTTDFGVSWSFDLVYDANIMTTSKGLGFVAGGMRYISGRFIQLCNDTPFGYWYSIAQDSSVRGATV